MVVVVVVVMVLVGVYFELSFIYLCGFQWVVCGKKERKRGVGVRGGIIYFLWLWLWWWYILTLVLFISVCGFEGVVCRRKKEKGEG